MTKFVHILHSESLQLKIRTFANHLLVVIAFFLPLNHGAVKSGFFALIILLLSQKNLLLQLRTALNNRVIISFIALLLLHYIGVTYSADPTRSLAYAGEMKFIFYSLIIIIFAEHRFIVRILSAFIFGVFLSELLSYALFFELLTSIPPLLDGSPIASKLEPSPFTFHVEYGYILSITSGFILHRLLIKTTNMEKFFLSLFLMTITLNVFLNSARTGYILFVISNAVILFFHYKAQILKKLPLVIPFALILLSIAWISSDNLQREYRETQTSFTQIIHGDFNSTLGTRLNFMRMGYNALKENNPLVGFGTDMHGVTVYNEAAKENNTMIMNWLYATGQGSGKIVFIDCEYNSILLQFGLIGLIIYLNLFYQIYHFKQEDSELNIVKKMIVVSSIFYAIVSSVFSGYLVPTLFVFIVSLTLIQKNDRQTVIMSNINIRSLFGYGIFIIGLFILSKLT